MKRVPRYVLLLPLFLLSFASPCALAQHAGDVQPFYENGKIHFVPSAEGSIFEGSFPTSGLFARSTTNPGFDSEGVFGLGLTPDDILSYHVLDDLFFWSTTTEDFAHPAASSITLGNAIGPDTIVDATSGMIAPGGVVGQADGGGDFHSHLEFTLSVGAEFGAYGLMLELSTDEPGIMNSDPLFFVFNYGLDDPTFEMAVDDFAALSEPELPGDYNLNLMVDSPDYTIWANIFGQMGPDLAADGNSNLMVDAPDYTIWANNFGATAAGPTPAPEPSALMLLCIAAAGLIAGRSVGRSFRATANERDVLSPD